MVAIQHQVSAFEDKYAYDQDMQFRITARRNALLGFWAASIMKNSDPQNYAQELAEMSVVDPSGVSERVSRDFEVAGIDGRDDEIHDRMRDLLRTASVELHQHL
ncbi:ATPase inhibitor subunit zeta [Rhizobium sp.]|jgi:hypothetical protein|uniref:ATPase inhibitor subunit zeta n=1 Tax=Rhizobium sp. TaxID=391 RepID=UPI000E990170|nr:DUF1476 domain-containing protein [Rhizobium sp.]